MINFRTVRISTILNLVGVLVILSSAKSNRKSYRRRRCKCSSYQTIQLEFINEQENLLITFHKALLFKQDLSTQLNLRFRILYELHTPTNPIISCHHQL